MKVFQSFYSSKFSCCDTTLRLLTNLTKSFAGLVFIGRRQNNIKTARWFFSLSSKYGEVTAVIETITVKKNFKSRCLGHICLVDNREEGFKAGRIPHSLIKCYLHTELLLAWNSLEIFLKIISSCNAKIIPLDEPS